MLSWDVTRPFKRLARDFNHSTSVSRQVFEFFWIDCLRDYLMLYVFCTPSSGSRALRLMWKTYISPLFLVTDYVSTRYILHQIIDCTTDSSS